MICQNLMSSFSLKNLFQKTFSSHQISWDDFGSQIHKFHQNKVSKEKKKKRSEADRKKYSESFAITN